MKVILQTPSALRLHPGVSPLCLYAVRAKLLSIATQPKPRNTQMGRLRYFEFL